MPMNTNKRSSDRLWWLLLFQLSLLCVLLPLADYWSARTIHTSILPWRLPQLPLFVVGLLGLTVSFGHFLYMLRNTLIFAARFRVLRRLLYALGVYLLIIIVFASVYYHKYVTKHSNFSFNQDIRAAQSVNIEEALASQLADANLSIEALRAIQMQIEIGKVPSVVNLRGNESPKFKVETAHSNSQIGITGLVFPDRLAGIFVSDLQDRRIAAFAEHVFSRHFSLLQFVKGNLDEEIRLQEDLQKRQAELHTEKPTLWSYWDFLYFSGTTLATVGFGDILPNTTTIRLLTLSEVLLGQLLLVFVVAALTQDFRSPR
jgi:hypothetical protein